jgi:nucleoside-diphosphate-sugar epimerase
MKVLLVGGTGFIGTYLYKDLINCHQVIRTYCHTPVADSVYFNAESDLISEIVPENFDIIINNINPSITSYKSVAAYITDLVCKCRKDNSWLINISSVSADEQNKFNDSYSLKKHIADEIIIGEMKGHKYTCLRFPQIFDYARLAKKSQAGFYYFIDAVRNREKIMLFANCRDVARNYLSVELLLDAITYTIENNISGLHNVFVPAHTLNLKEIVALIAGMNTDYDAESLIQQSEKEGITYHIPLVSVAFAQWYTGARDFSYYLSKAYHFE